MKILDCTLRDGGYYTNLDFNTNLVNTYLEAFNSLPVDYLEIGYRSNPMNAYLGEFFYCPIYVLEGIKQRSKKKLAIMLNEKDVHKEHVRPLLEPCKGLVNLVRIAVDPQNISRSYALAHEVKRLGFEVGFNVMYMSAWAEDKDFFKNLDEVNNLADFFYLVDSFGGVYPKDVALTMNMVKEVITKPIGFHGHNNLELALINTLTAIEHGAEIVDATITGMGRGAGNLKTELLLTVLNANGTLTFDFNALSKVVDPFAKMQQQYDWGTNLPYMVSGAHSLPQKNVMEWVSKRYYSFNSIIRALSNESKGIKDNQKLPVLDFKQEKKYEAVLIIGGGPSAAHHATAVHQLLAKHVDMLVIHASSRNAMNYYGIENEQLFCLVGNEGHRLEDVFGDASKVIGKCVLPPFPRKMGTYIPKALQDKAFELSKVSFTPDCNDTHTALALQSAIELGIRKVFIVGYDGYSGGQMGEREQELFMENEKLFAQAKAAGLECIALTSTGYKEITHNSIYNFV